MIVPELDSDLEKEIAKPEWWLKHGIVSISESVELERPSRKMVDLLLSTGYTKEKMELGTMTNMLLLTLNTAGQFHCSRELIPIPTPSLKFPYADISKLDRGRIARVIFNNHVLKWATNYSSRVAAHIMWETAMRAMEKL